MMGLYRRLLEGVLNIISWVSCSSSDVTSVDRNDRRPPRADRTRPILTDLTAGRRDPKLSALTH